jgi:S-adenosylmethionine:tRNA ribosyltransferase-isomerase
MFSFLLPVLSPFYGHYIITILRKEMQLSDFDYYLPKELIAQFPPIERHHSRMMIVYRESGEIVSSNFIHLHDFLQPGDMLVVNNSKVIPARLFAEHLNSGRLMELLLTRETQTNRWEALVKKARYVKKGNILSIPNEDLNIKVVEELKEGKRVLEFHHKGDILTLLNKIGSVPLPPYIKRKAIEDIDRERYQTVFARKSGSVAAPTGGLHFSPKIINELKKMGIEFTEITLHIGPGTFRPIRSEEIEKHKMDEEHFIISHDSARRINAALKEKRRIIAIGTSTTRALESWAIKRKEENNYLESDTNLFIRPGFDFLITKGLLTNFHLPKSSLLLLVSAFAGRELILKAYKQAMKEKYKFYSYGDCMLIL